MLVIILIRLLAGLLIFRYPLFGGLLAIVLDYIDYSFLEAFELNNMNHYQELDKILDFFYLSLEAYVAISFKNRYVKNTALALFFYRAVGNVVFYITKQEALLVFFPNLFEWFYLLYLLQLKFLKLDYLSGKKNIVILLAVLLIPKMAHEYFLHVNKTRPWTQNYFVKQFFNL